ncbi:MAG: MFS transporter, partial [Microbacterium sp.]
MSQSEGADAERSELYTEARAESARPGGLAGPLAERTDEDGIGAASPAPATPGRPRSLWRDSNFLTLWSGQAFSQFGSQIQELAIPVLAVLFLNASEFQVGVLNAAGVAAFLVVGLPAGAWIDRMRKRHVMIWADGVRAVALAALPLL